MLKKGTFPNYFWKSQPYLSVLVQKLKPASLYFSQPIFSYGGRNTKFSIFIDFIVFFINTMTPKPKSANLSGRSCMRHLKRNVVHLDGYHYWATVRERKF
jgi:hypothetical protein